MDCILRMKTDKRHTVDGAPAAHPKTSWSFECQTQFMLLAFVEARKNKDGKDARFIPKSNLKCRRIVFQVFESERL